MVRNIQKLESKFAGVQRSAQSGASVSAPDSEYSLTEIIQCTLSSGFFTTRENMTMQILLTNINNFGTNSPGANIRRIEEEDEHGEDEEHNPHDHVRLDNHLPLLEYINSKNRKKYSVLYSIPSIQILR